MDLFEQIRGMSDCREGKEPQSQDESYLNGYGLQIQAEENLSNGGEYGLKRTNKAANCRSDRVPSTVSQ